MYIIREYENIRKYTATDISLRSAAKTQRETT